MSKTRGEIAKELWQRPEFRAKRQARKADYARMMGEKSKQWWQDPDYRERKSEWGRKLLTELWQDSGFRETQINRMLEDNPARQLGASKKLSDAKKKNWEDPEYRQTKSEQASAQIKLQRETTDFQDRASLGTSKRLKMLWQDPEYRASMGEIVKKLWDDPIHKKRMRELFESLWKNEEYRAMVVSRTILANHVRPTKPEQHLINLIEKHNFPFIYVGDGSFIIEGKCPDFINSNGAKQIIEVFGDYWHSEEVIGKPVDEAIEERVRIFAGYGFSTLIIWQHELQQNEELVAKKVREFTEGLDYESTTSSQL